MARKALDEISIDRVYEGVGVSTTVSLRTFYLHPSDFGVATVTLARRFTVSGVDESLEVAKSRVGGRLLGRPAISWS